MRHRFGTFTFDDEAGELRKGGRVVALEPQPGRALARLLARAGEVVSRDELREAVWGADTHVDFDRGLAYCLSQIRSALGDSGDNPRFVQTLPKKGYKFIAPAFTEASAGTPDARLPTPGSRLPTGAAGGWWKLGVASILVAAAVFAWATGRTTPGPRAIVAVSIFDNESGLAEHDRLVTGLSDVVVASLTELAPDRLAVIGNAAVVRQPRNIRNLQAVADGVKADYVLLGQLQEAEGGLRFITHLIRLRDETHLKANRIPLPGGDVSGLEAAVVAEFERAVREHVLK